MVLVTIFLLCSIASVDGTTLTLDPDLPFVRRSMSGEVTLECCYNTTGSGTVYSAWFVTTAIPNGTRNYMVDMSKHRVSEGNNTRGHSSCRRISMKKLQFSDAGLYRCFLKKGNRVGVWSHGTFLQVFKPMNKILNLPENVKNNILAAQGILLLLCVLLPGAKLLCKSKQIYALEKKKAMREEENIYEGLRIEDFSSPYDQIQRAPAETTYQDVYMSEGEVNLEKP